MEHRLPFFRFPFSASNGARALLPAELRSNGGLTRRHRDAGGWVSSFCSVSLSSLLSKRTAGKSAHAPFPAVCSLLLAPC